MCFCKLFCSFYLPTARASTNIRKIKQQISYFGCTGPFMLINILISLIAGVPLGWLYGIFFVKRIRNYFVISEHTDQNTSHYSVKTRPLIILLSFLTSYLFVGCTLYILMCTFHINVLWGAVFFLTTFWIIAWRHSKKLL
jgi:hypothetical protein